MMMDSSPMLPSGWKQSNTLRSLEETSAFAAALATELTANALILLRGDLGAGKTTFVKALVKALNGDSESVHSPTFSYFNIYETQKGFLYHFDLYRLKSAEEFEAGGFTEYLFEPGVCCIEWPERIEPILSTFNLYPYTLHFSHKDEETRQVRIS